MAIKTATKSSIQSNTTLTEKVIKTMIVLKLVQIRVESFLTTETIFKHQEKVVRTLI